MFAPSPGSLKPVAGNPFTPGDHWLVGCVGRLQTVKNQPLLVRAFLRLLAEHPQASGRMRLVIVGEGPLRADIEALLAASGKRDWVWLAGARDDVPDIMKILDCFALPSQAEGTSCTLQEAIASGLPVVATAVGGTPDLVANGANGLLVPSDDVQALSNALWRIYSEPGLGQELGRVGREKALASFALSEMILSYDLLLLGTVEVLPSLNKPSPAPDSLSRSA